ncbi:MAG: hypothetical protein RH946_18215 [Rhodospirillales bacterium]
MSFFSGFFDYFFLICLSFVLAISFLDFILGKKKREKFRERLEDLWLYIEVTEYAGLVRNDARKILNLFYNYFGRSVLSFKFFSRVFVVSVLFYILTGELFYIYANGKAGLLWSALGNSAFQITLLSLAPLNFVADFFSLAITMRLLLWMSKYQLGLPTLMLIIVLDIVVALILTSLVLILNIFPAALVVGSGDRGGLEETYLFFLASAMFTSVAPTLFHMVVAFFFIVSKFFYPLIKPPCSIIVLRLSESPKGPLSLIGFGLGAIVKLSQQWLKVLST